MDKIISKVPVRITVEFAGGNVTDADIGGFAALFPLLAPGETDLGGEFGDVFVILKISPKFDLGAGLSFDNFTNYGDGWCDMPPGAAPDY